MQVDIQYFQAHKRPFAHGGVPVILHPARLLPWKGVHLSVQMLSSLRQRGIEARLIITDTQRIADWNSELARYQEQIMEMTRSTRKWRSAALTISVAAHALAVRFMPRQAS